jgi:hypothetical protein
MKKLPIPEKYGYTVFCDDIRNEVDGKTTHIGIYNGTMIFAAPFPVQIPKFGISITLALLPEDNADYSFQVYLPGDEEGVPSIAFDAPGEAARKDTPIPEMVGDDPRFALKVSGVFSPLLLTKEGFIEVRAVKGDEYLRVGRLRVISSIATATNE